MIALSDGFGRFFSDVNDFEGHGNEVLFPTLNSPRDLAHHVLVFRVHNAAPYLMVGSGRVVTQTAGDVQEWTLDTEREVASYTVMFFLAPETRRGGGRAAGRGRGRAGDGVSRRGRPRSRPTSSSARGWRSCRRPSGPSPCPGGSASS